MAKLILTDRRGNTLSLSRSLSEPSRTIFHEHLRAGKSIGQCSGHGICKGCVVKINEEDQHKFVTVLDHPHDLKSDERLACCTVFKPDDENEATEVQTPRNAYMGI